MNERLLSGLRSVEIGLADVPAAEAFFTETWNLSVAAREGGVVYLRGTGADHHLLALHPRASSQLLSVTLRASSADALDTLARNTKTHGGMVVHARSPVTEPGGGEAVTVVDPQGRVLRFVHGDEQHSDIQEQRDRPSRLAHAVMNSHDVAAVQPFYENALGFRLSDRTRIMAFLRLPQAAGGDHHSIALADADNDCLNHIAFVMPSMESVMRGGGRMKDAGYAIEWGPGRHGPGDNIFNYFVGPGGFVIEYTADVEQVDDSHVARGPQDWKWPPGRLDQWGIAVGPTPRLKDAQKQIAFAKPGDPS
ncbi:MAG: VOC family protein [Burkholderiales bacterium]|nr:VOC family protein [Burkholderiales bacterium]